MKKHKLSLSVIIPVFNEEDHLKACLDSISTQTVKPDEVIVVDNNSTDRSAKIAQQYNFVKLVREKRQGIAPARDAGFNAAKSDLIGRLDADTILPDNWVEKVLELYGGRADFALTGGGYFYNMSLPRFNGWALGQIAYRMNRFIMGHYILWGSNMVVPRTFWQAAKNEVCSDNKHIHEDLDLAIHLHRLGYKIHYQENLRVGVEMKRVYARDNAAFKANLSLWPETLYVHHLKRAWLGKLGAGFLYYGTFAFMIPTDQVIKTYKTARQQIQALLRVEP